MSKEVPDDSENEQENDDEKDITEITPKETPKEAIKGEPKEHPKRKQKKHPKETPKEKPQESRISMKREIEKFEKIAMPKEVPEDSKNEQENDDKKDVIEISPKETTKGTPNETLTAMEQQIEMANTNDDTKTEKNGEEDEPPKKKKQDELFDDFADIKATHVQRSKINELSVRLRIDNLTEINTVEQKYAIKGCLYKMWKMSEIDIKNWDNAQLEYVNVEKDQWNCTKSKFEKVIVKEKPNEYKPEIEPAVLLINCIEMEAEEVCPYLYITVLIYYICNTLYS